jgi:hypothetical protein
VALVQGDVRDPGAVLAAASVRPDAVVATFVLSLLADQTGLWTAVDEVALERPVRVALAELGEPNRAPRVLRPVLGALTALGGGDATREPWRQLAARAPDTVEETLVGGHVHLAVGTCGAPR